MSNAVLTMQPNHSSVDITDPTTKLLHRLRTERLLLSNRLVLMVDLDHTLLHTSTKDVANIDCKEDMIRWRWNELSEWRITKIRPYTDQFLKNMSQLYELRICTMAGSLYANQMAKLLDKDHFLFGNRIHSRDDLPDNSRSKKGHLTNLFPCDDDMVVIIDDRKDVWDSPPNLIRVKRYYYFTRDSDNKIVVPTVDDDDHLIYLEHLLRRIHSDFFTAVADYRRVNDRSVPVPNTKSVVAKIKGLTRRKKRRQQLKSRSSV